MVEIFGTGPVVSGSKSRSAKTWKFCPYSTQITPYNGDTRVPEGEKIYHQETEGKMHSYSISGVMGWACADNECPFFTGAATTEVFQFGVRFTPDVEDCESAVPLGISGIHTVISGARTIVPGSRYIET